jgi:hypothetical protein
VPNPLYIGIRIASDPDTLWNLTQSPELHERWDLRFSTIEYLPKPDPDAPQRFRYATRIGLGLTVEGWGESIAARVGDSVRTSSLRFGSESPISLIREGSGYWKYTRNGDAMEFETGYDYRTRFGPAGRLFDRVVFRPLLGWATAWSFDRLRLWIERGIDPTLSAQRAITHAAARIGLAAVFFWHGLVPKLLVRHPDEMRLIEESGVPAGLAPTLLTAAGILEVAYATALILLWRARWMYLLTAILLTLLLVPALFADASLVTDPFSPVTLTIALLALCLVGWAACKDLPSARHCRRHPDRSRVGISRKETA